MDNQLDILNQFSSSTKEARSQIRWQCRRGMLELELVLCSFFDKAYDDLSSADKTSFKKLLEYPDPVLYDWFLGRGTPDSTENANIVNLIHSKRAVTPWKRSSLFSEAQ